MNCSKIMTSKTLEETVEALIELSNEGKEYLKK